MNYDANIELGQHYRDIHTGFEGTATAVTFFEHGCPIVVLSALVAHAVTDTKFEAPRLKHIEGNGSLGFA